jgi:prepilin-type N-terminal cleavage/methylation domain-containing protein
MFSLQAASYKLQATRPGFTLVELLTVISIIGLLSSIATVSYDSARAKTRDASRLANLDTVRKALEFSVNDTGGYPVDGVKGEGGIVLGGPGAHVLDSDGWTDAPEGDVYIQNLPKNPGPYGADYVYESLNNDGSPCDVGPCPSYRVSFFLETDFVGLSAGPQVQTPEGVKTPSPEVAASIASRATRAATVTIAAAAMPVINAVVEAKRVVLDNPVVETSAQVAVAPAGTVAVVAAAATAVPATQYGFYLYLFFTQPFLLLRRRGRRAETGVVYDAGTKLPVDLAIVRLVNAANGRIVGTQVTDGGGRFMFLPPKGKYRIEVTKPGFVFPSKNLAGAVSDGNYQNLYFGADFSMSERGAVSPAVPVDAAEEAMPETGIIKNYLKNRTRSAIAFSGFGLAAFSFAAKPGIYLGSVLALHILLYFFFRRLAKRKNRGRFGVVSDEATRRPVGRAVVRLFSLPYHKLVATEVSDRRGRYYFLVGKNNYYVTVTHPGYWKTESYPLDLSNASKPEVIAANLAVRPVSLAPDAPTPA